MNVSTALEKLKEAGYKFTDKREEMLRFLEQKKGYVSAKDVLEHMQQTYPALSFDTIYRNLSLFGDLNIADVTELNGEKLFRLQCDTHGHHHHFICLTCGKTKAIHACPMEGLKEDLNDFDVTGHKFEIYGKCKSCK